jgi:lysophospholipase L1-like esterase
MSSIPWRRFIAVGDSLTEGVGDPTPTGLRGWADRLADGLKRLEPELIYANLAQRGLTTREVIDTQLERALTLKPDLTTAVVGMNDLIRPEFDDATFESDLDELVGALSSEGATVMMGTYGEITKVLRASARVKVPLEERLLRANDVIRTVAARHGAPMVEARGMAESIDVRSYSVDRLHPSPRGPLLIAHAYAAALSGIAGTTIELQDPESGPIGAGKFTQARWIVRQIKPGQIARYVVRSRLG